VAPADPDRLSPLRPREFFARPWAGEGEWIPRRGLRWLPGPRRLRFRSTASWLSDDLWLVHDETTWEDGYTLSPYSMAIAAPAFPVPILVRCVDSCRLEPGGELSDVIEISLPRLRLGRQVMRLRRE